MDSQDDELVRLLADPVNRSIVTALDDADRALSVTEVVERIISRDATASPRSSDSEDERSRLIISLHHDRLPRLEDAGLLEYDRDTTTVTASARSMADDERMYREALDGIFSQLRTGNGTDGSAIEVLSGRDEIYEYTRNLADETEHELFLIYASDDLLDEDCLPHAKRAIERDVEFYAGTKSRDARRFFRDCLSEATIWEPQMDWLYERTTCPRISRLIVADREKVVVGLWNEESDGTKTEVAMVGEGRTNPLVVLVRELLGSRLDHLDYQSDDFMGDLPFEA